MVAYFRSISIQAIHSVEEKETNVKCFFTTSSPCIWSLLLGNSILGNFAPTCVFCKVSSNICIFDISSGSCAYLSSNSDNCCACL